MGRNVFQPKITPDEARAYCRSGATTIITYCLAQPSASRLAIAMCLTTGMREGELVVLQLTDFNWIHSKYFVHREEIENRTNGGYEDVEHGKTPRSTRYIELSRDAKQVYDACIGFKKTKSPWLFESRESCKGSGHIHSSALRAAITTVNQRLNMPFDCSMHDCRRTYASIAYHYGSASIKWLQGQLGNESQTWDYIVDILDRNEKQDMANSFNLL